QLSLVLALDEHILARDVEDEEVVLKRRQRHALNVVDWHAHREFVESLADFARAQDEVESLNCQYKVATLSTKATVDARALIGEDDALLLVGTHGVLETIVKVEAHVVTLELLVHARTAAILTTTEEVSG